MALLLRFFWLKSSSICPERADFKWWISNFYYTCSSMSSNAMLASWSESEATKSEFGGLEFSLT